MPRFLSRVGTVSMRFHAASDPQGKLRSTGATTIPQSPALDAAALRSKPDRCKHLFVFRKTSYPENPKENDAKVPRS